MIDFRKSINDVLARCTHADGLDMLLITSLIRDALYGVKGEQQLTLAVSTADTLSRLAATVADDLRALQNPAACCSVCRKLSTDILCDCPLHYDMLPY